MAGAGALLASRVSTQKEERVLKKIPVGAILTVANLSVTERGPLGSERTVLTFDGPDHKNTFGGHFADGLNALVVEAFFKEAPGSRLRQSRVVHYTDVTDPTTKASLASTTTIQTEALAETKGFVLGTIQEPFVFADGDDLDFSVDGGGTDTATFNVTAAEEESSAETYDLSSGGETLLLKIDQGSVQTITFQTSMFGTPAAATAIEVAAAVNAQLVGGYAITTTGDTIVQIWSDTLGTGSYVEITGGTANSELAFPTSEIQGTGDAADASAVTAAELVTLITGDVTGATATDASGYLRVETDTPGTGGTIQVEASSTMDDELGLDNAIHTGTDAGAVDTLKVSASSDGDWGDQLSIVISAPTSGDSDRFKLQVYRDGTLIETWDNLSMIDTDDRYVELLVNPVFVESVQASGSLYITTEDLDAAVPSPDDLPAIATHGPMVGGDDGLTSINDADYNGGTGVNGRTGLRTFDLDTDIDVLMSPDRATSSHQNAMITYCDITREELLFAILDSPEGYTAQQMATWVQTTAALFGLTENAAIYWPRGRVTNPAREIYGSEDLITIPICGSVAGVMGRTDASKIGGMWEQPAGLATARLPRSIEQLETDEVKDINKRNLLVPLNINMLSVEEGTSIFLDGARNLDIGGDWNSIGSARGVMFTRKRIQPALGPLRHSNLRDRLYNEGEQILDEFLGSFRAADAFLDYSIDIGEDLNTPRIKAQRRILVRIGIARYEVGEYVDVTIGVDSEQLQAQFEAAA
jgi:hypothetical protein